MKYIQQFQPIARVTQREVVVGRSPNAIFQ
jgi:hypothetical protein